MIPLRRLAPPLGGLLAVGLIVLAAIGAGPFLAAPLLALVVGAWLVVARHRLDGAADVSWTGSTPAAAAAPMDRAAERRLGGVALALARVEARELVTSPWFGAGLGFLAVVFVMFGVLWVEDNERSWWTWFLLAPAVVHPFLGMAVIGVHRATSRSRREGCEELF
ncbi:MAG TPA: hypothetical protein VHN78_16115, partial [Chloroflexota bacterium]|nr:hypothetical protein [Chloroflexota bacterium]